MSDSYGSSRRDALKTFEGVTITSLLAGCNGPLTTTADSQQRRNVVFVFSDDHRYDFVDFVDEAGTPDFLNTPRLNQMAAEGAHVRNAFVNTSLCGPSRATVLTGRHTHEHEVLNNSKPIPRVEETFPKQLQKAGYETAFIGKWHLFQSNSAHPQPGFDHWVSFNGQGRYFGQNLNVNGKHVNHDEYITDLLTEYALDWIRNRDDDRPFFLFLSHKAVHNPFRPAPRHEGRYADAAIAPPETIDETKKARNDKPEWVNTQRNKPFGVASRDFEKLYRRYCETVLALDESIGAVMEYLDGSGLAESTLMLYTSDNGFLIGEHGLVDKRVAYEPSIRIPLVAYAPGLIEPGTEVTDFVSNIDVAPTILDVANQSSHETIDGRSFLPLLTGEGVDQWRDALFYEYFWSPKFPHPPGQFALRTETEKYALSYGRPDTNEFYDLERDPHERHNRIDADDYQKRILQVKRRLFDRLKETDSLLYPINLPSLE